MFTLHFPALAQLPASWPTAPSTPSPTLPPPPPLPLSSSHPCHGPPTPFCLQTSMLSIPALRTCPKADPSLESLSLLLLEVCRGWARVK